MFVWFAQFLVPFKLKCNDRSNSCARDCSSFTKGDDRFTARLLYVGAAWLLVDTNMKSFVYYSMIFPNKARSSVFMTCKTKHFCLGCQFQKRSRMFSNHMQLSPVVHYRSQQSCCCVERELKLYPGTAARHAAVLVLIKRILPYISIAWTALSFYVFLKDVHMNKRKVWTPMTATRSCGCCFFFFFF